METLPAGLLGTFADGRTMAEHLPTPRVGSAVDMQDLSGHEGGRLKIEHRIDNFLNFAHAMHGMQAGEKSVRLARAWGS